MSRKEESDRDGLLLGPVSGCADDTRIVVVKGACLSRDAPGEKRVGPGDFIWVPGGMKHWSGGDVNEGALFYQESSGKFDLVPVN